MIEQTILGYLSDVLDVPVMMELPEVPSEDFPTFPERFVVVEKVGSSRANHVYQDSIALQSYSLESMYDAASLDEIVRDAMDNIVELDAIGGVRLSSNYNHTDTRTDRYRYQCVYEVYHV